MLKISSIISFFQESWGKTHILHSRVQVGTITRSSDNLKGFKLKILFSNLNLSHLNVVFSVIINISHEISIGNMYYKPVSYCWFW